MRFFNMMVGVVCALAIGASAAQAPAADPVKVGAVLSLTGSASSLGDPELKTLEMMVDQTNRAGGLLGRLVELVHYDDGSEPGKANVLAKRLIEDDKVDMLIGGTTTGASMAMYPLIERAQIPFISLAGALVIVEPVKRWMFKPAHHDRMVGQRVMLDMKARGYTSIAMLSDTSGFGQSARKEMLNVAQKVGITVAVDETFNPKDTDVTTQLAKIKNTPGVQALFVVTFGQGAVVVTKNIAQLGIELPHYETSGVATREYIRLAGPAAEGVRLPAPVLMVAADLPDSDPQKKLSVDYVREYESRYQTDVSSFGAYARDAWHIWVNAVTQARSVDKAKVRDFIENTTGLPGTSGMINMSPQDHLGLDISALKIVTVRNGKFAIAD
ncbi:branched-chain amino acid transport system substrate-binding protein [Azospirillum lipoferum]|uniref:ABC transporter substrate-binding protein n=1 Tax=Azospirillum lipoferum TaxID=193 RepID=A0A5A9GMJ0_AZOLI|nr:MULTISPECIES: ABC transporter substrate-binding protein [Azospirillum]KAA0595621.1 ABC transporter substrate-binding protein [Azospirillum lipoferum]MCP1611525.1 branched-chain amino acid transport system substrate-binding protein [Azospirillum lipoferum]MDW5537324.1 ABC transporter substrate-binding protein [Azospirillum sp. NL1]